MHKIVEGFKKLSLTQQVLLVVFLFVAFFFGFFFLFVTNNIDRTIANQMYDTMASRQESIAEALKDDEDVLESQAARELVGDTLQTNGYIQDGTLYFFDKSDQNSGTKGLYQKMLVDAGGLNKDNPVYEAMYQKSDTVYYYYRLQYVKINSDDVIIVSFMNSDYPQQVRKSLVDSTIDVVILAYFVMFVALMLWVYSIIHPLHQIKAYIEEIKMGKEVELHINREDEIGEVADALVTMKDELKKQETAKEEMIHNISHDLKTPIATIKSYAESIKDGIYPYGTLDKSVDVIIENAQRLEDKVHNLLYLNRVEYLLTSDAEGVVTNMKEVIEQVVLNTKVIRPEIRIEMEIEEVFFDGLLEAWRVVIENIMENAFRYAKSYIKIELHEDNLKISNDGPKMQEDRIEVLFRPYEKGEGGRFGLGLSIVAKVCKANKYLVRGFNTDDGVCFEIYRKPKPKPKKKNERRRSRKL
ncbi:sensor histidine kinase [Catenisphaera adipataccumulans]|uniref:histidine kinase n=1 Tax=Catenisphaera adipataccumulans TaxID=700500 RepID=A0A7W8D1E1_9FIRM|nr:HAMP domain-containing sensor histidine kinase [Catenisphaera adipataccumulans]MBB5183770.1 two-component system sensor histidine kinase CssS [Catenisphaera adipataccumulans]